MEDERLRAAARIAYVFHLDPLSVLNADQYEWAIRLAASKVIEGDLKKK